MYLLGNVRQVIYYPNQHKLFTILTSLVAQMVKNLSAVQETQIQSLCQEDPLEKGMATHSSILAWRIPVCGVTKSRTRLSLSINYWVRHMQPLSLQTMICTGLQLFLGDT